MKYKNITRFKQSFVENGELVVVEPNKSIETDIDLGNVGCFETVEKKQKTKTKEDD